MRVVTGDAETGSALVSQWQARMISFTGGFRTANAIVKAAGVKKYSMDLGGNAPVIVMADCDLDHAVAGCVSGAFWAAGQNCVGTQRILIHQYIYEQFRQAFIESVGKLIVGDPIDESTDMGPMINEASAIGAESAVDRALQQGATLLAGHNRDGSLYQPTVLEDVAAQQEIWTTEIFAPIVILSRFRDLEEALALANGPEISLHSGIFTENLSDALNAAEQLQMGGVMINDSSDYRFDAMPFGGFKLGSIGREGVRFAVEEMTQPKVVCFNRRDMTF